MTSAVPSPDTAFHLLSTTRYDDALLEQDWNTRVNDGRPSSFMLLRYHFDRLVNAAEQHGWWRGAEKFTYLDLLRGCEAAVQEAQKNHGCAGPFRVRMLVVRDGSLSAVASLAHSLPSLDVRVPPSSSESTRTVYVDREPTPPSLFTRTKTTHRVMYNAARARFKLGPLPTPSDAHLDVLLHNPNGLVTETSIRNVAFRRGDLWVTPRAHSGCLPGVMRRLMLAEGRFVEGDIHLEDVCPGDEVLTVNGVEGCRAGKIAFLPDAET